MNLRVDVKRRCLVAFVAGAACAGLMSADSRAQPPENAAVTATNAFALDLYRALAQDSRNDGDNLWFSPYSITSALAMAAEGARGNTRAQMASTLHFGDASQLARIHEGIAALDLQSTSDARESVSVAPAARGRPAPMGRPGPHELVVANALWGDQRYPFDPGYVDTLAQYYGVAGVFPVDFLRNAEAARLQINAWVEEQTRGKIADLLLPGSVSGITRLVLTNAVYFKGSWMYPFNARQTVPQPFHLDTSKSVSVPTMQMTASVGYVENDDVQMLWMPFVGQAGAEVSMLVVLPKQVDGLARVEQSLTVEALNEWGRDVYNRRVRVFLPKFKMTSRLSLERLLPSMGMRDAFDSSTADFSGISPAALQDRLFISQVVHRAFLDVDEVGAEAAAATGVGMAGAGRGGQQEIVDFRADHPFLVLIRHNRTGAILFLGRLMDPGDK